MVCAVVIVDPGPAVGRARRCRPSRKTCVPVTRSAVGCDDAAPHSTRTRHSGPSSGLARAAPAAGVEPRRAAVQRRHAGSARHGSARPTAAGWSGLRAGGHAPPSSDDLLRGLRPRRPQDGQPQEASSPPPSSTTAPRTRSSAGPRPPCGRAGLVHRHEQPGGQRPGRLVDPAVLDGDEFVINGQKV